MLLVMVLLPGCSLFESEGGNNSSGSNGESDSAIVLPGKGFELLPEIREGDLGAGRVLDERLA
jgi:hypothetical protein